MPRKNLDASHFGELVEHLFRVDRHQEEPVYVDILERAQRVLRVLHRDAIGHARVVAGVLGATSYVNRFLGGKGIAENNHTGVPVSGGAAHLLRILKLADYDATKPQ